MKDYKLFFNVIQFKDYLKKFKDASEKLEYLKYVKNEYSDLFYHYNDVELGMFLKEHNLDDKVEINYLVGLFTNKLNRVDGSMYASFLKNIRDRLLPFVEKEISILNTELNEPTLNKEIKNNEDLVSPEVIKTASDVIVNPNNLIKLRWQKENVLLTYLFDALFKEGFISNDDYSDRHKFIAQSFIKSNGKPFTSKESDQSQLNYSNNKKTNKKPRNAFKVDRVIEKVKSKTKKP